MTAIGANGTSRTLAPPEYTQDEGETSDKCQCMRLSNQWLH
jgi:hypothetical protein